MLSLDDAEVNLNRAISLAESMSESKLKLVNTIRLGHVKHWKKDFTQAHRLFDRCLEVAIQDNSCEEYLDFIFQHKAKCFFDEGIYEAALAHFHKAILIRNNKSDTELADSTLLAIEETKKRYLPQVSNEEAQRILADRQLPQFVLDVFHRTHGKELPMARYNCINAALQFHGLESHRLEPFKPMELLRFVVEKTEQINSADDFQFGDLVIWWNRSGGPWDHKKISIKDMNFKDSDFPYGLIFDHVAVRITSEIVFNKPNPAPHSEYKFDFLETAAYPSKLGKGHEMTLHRIRKTR